MYKTFQHALITCLLFAAPFHAAAANGLRGPPCEETAVQVDEEVAREVREFDTEQHKAWLAKFLELSRTKVEENTPLYVKQSVPVPVNAALLAQKFGDETMELIDSQYEEQGVAVGTRRFLKIVAGVYITASPGLLNVALWYNGVVFFIPLASTAEAIGAYMTGAYAVKGYVFVARHTRKLIDLLTDKNPQDDKLATNKYVVDQLQAAGKRPLLRQFRMASLLAMLALIGHHAPQGVTEHDVQQVVSYESEYARRNNRAARSIPDIK